MIKSKEKNILLLWDRMGDYHRARWNALQECADVNVYAADLFASDSLYKWESTEDSDLFTCLSIHPRTGSVSNGFFPRLKAFRRILKDKHIATVFIPGYQHSIYLLFILVAKWYNCRVVLFAESWYRSHWLIETPKSWFLRIFVDRFFVSGKRAEEHFSDNLNIKRDKITRGYSVVDNLHFTTSDLAKKSDAKIVLCVARYAPEKNLDMLIRAFIQSDLCETWRLVLLGDGPERELLEQQTAHHHNIELTGWKHYNELPEWYAKASCFILPSKFEPWGLAVNEAMAAGLPIIISEECGCAPDLLNDANGWSFSASNLSALVTILNTVASFSSEQLESMGNISDRIIENYSVGTWADKASSLHT